MKFAITIFFIISLLQQKDEFSYRDSFDREIIIQNYSKLPKEIDTAFFKSKINSEYFKEQLLNKKYDFLVRIWEVKKVSKTKYDIRAQVLPRKKGETRYYEWQNPSNYRLQIKKVNNEYIIKTFTYTFGEV